MRRFGRLLLSVVLVGMAAHAAGVGPFPRSEERSHDRAAEKSYNTEPCDNGQAWTCTIQCRQNTRTPFEHFTNAPGVDVCVALTCTCQPQVVPGLPSVNTPGLPVVLVTFGVRELVQPGQP